MARHSTQNSKTLCIKDLGAMVAGGWLFKVQCSAPLKKIATHLTGAWRFS
jgi:hypothetical protein